jgi:hypothetical protein
MNLLDITLATEVLMPNNINPIKILLEENIKSEDLEVLKLFDVSVVQKELSTGNYALIVRFCFEHPAQMIKSEVEDYSEKALTKLKIIFEEVVSSKNKVFSIKSSIIKFS